MTLRDVRTSSSMGGPECARKSSSAASTSPIVERADVKEKMFGSGLEGIASSPEEFLAIMRSDIQKWGAVIRDAGIRE